MKKVLVALLLLVLAGGAAVAGYLWYRDQQVAMFARTPFGAGEPKVVEIPKESPRALAQLLAQKGVVSSADQFWAYLHKEKLAPKLKAGEYQFEPNLTPEQVAQKLIKGEVKSYKFTVPEGLRMDEIIPILAGSELKLDAAKLTELVKDKAFAHKLGVPAPAENLEGFLYPDTYLFTRPFSETSVITKMVSRALDEYRKADAHRKAGVVLNPLQTMTLASIIEKETAATEERPRISCVFHNRLRLKMKLGTDPTVLYAMMLMRGHFVKNITSKDLLTPHPYNTYTTAGLPPGPIANPGAEAIRAALNPLDCNDLYFVSRNNGTHQFCPDLKCHNAAVERFQKHLLDKKTSASRN